jgi:hypothetical protein
MSVEDEERGRACVRLACCPLFMAESRGSPAVYLLSRQAPGTVSDYQAPSTSSQHRTPRRQMHVRVKDTLFYTYCSKN